MYRPLGDEEAGWTRDGLFRKSGLGNPSIKKETTLWQENALGGLFSSFSPSII